jgi:hypothetical protein
MAGHQRSARILCVRFAEQLLDAECPGYVDRGAVVGAAVAVLNGFHEALTPLVGSAGWEVLLGRATILVARRYEGLGPLVIPKAEPLSREEVEAALPAEAAAARDVAAALVCEILSYMARLVDWPLALSLLRPRWPAVVDRYDAGDFDDPSSPPQR